jgi:hypothetical protein
MNQTIVLIIILAISIFLFFVLRGAMLWYWNIDVIVKNQEEQKKIMREQNDLLKQFIKLNGGKIYNDDLLSMESKEEIERKAKLFDASSKS